MQSLWPEYTDTFSYQPKEMSWSLPAQETQRFPKFGTTGVNPTYGCETADPTIRVVQMEESASL